MSQSNPHARPRIHRHWWQNDGNVCALIRWLDKKEGLNGTEAARIFEEPWSWETEWQQFKGDPESLTDEEIIALVRNDYATGFWDRYPNEEIARFFRGKKKDEILKAARGTHLAAFSNCDSGPTENRQSL